MAPPADVADAVAAVYDRRSESPSTENGGHRPPLQQATADDDGPPPIDEAAESAFLAEARERGEPVRATPTTEPAEETDPKELPPLDALVQRIPANVRETLDELFRAKFVRVQRVPKKALKS